MVELEYNEAQSECSSSSELPVRNNDMMLHIIYQGTSEPYLYPHVGDTGKSLLGHLFYCSHGEPITPVIYIGSL